MADSARHNLFLVPESTYGVVPASNPAFVDVRHTGTTLALSKEAFQSEELHEDRQIRDQRHGVHAVGGDHNFELSFGSFDQLLQAALGGTWTTRAAAYNASTISAAASDNSLNDSGDSFPALSPGDKILIAGFTGETDNNGTATVVSRTTSKIVISGITLVDDAEGESVTVTPLTETLKAGTARRSFSFLRHFTDLESGDKPYHLFKGVEVNAFNLAVPANGMITGSFGLVGQGLVGPLSDMTDYGTPTYGDPTTTKPMDSFTGSITEGGSSIAIVTELSLALANGLAPRNIIGSKETIQPTIGRSNLTGSITAYFENASLFEKFVNETESALNFDLPDPAGNSYEFDLPRIKYNGGQPDVSGEGSVTLNMPIQALRDATEGSNLVIRKHHVS
jgi:hypothetical protein